MIAISPAASAETTSAAELRAVAGLQSLRIEVSGEIDAPLEAVRSVLLDLPRYKEWFPAIREWRLISKDSERALVYGRQSLPWPWQDRDYVVRYVWSDAAPDSSQDQSVSSFQLEATTSPQPDLGPITGIVRIDEMTTLWTLQTTGAQAQKTSVLYIYEGDPQIEIPEWIVRSAWQRHTNQVVERVASEVLRRRSEAERRPPLSEPNGLLNGPTSAND